MYVIANIKSSIRIGLNNGMLHNLIHNHRPIAKGFSGGKIILLLANKIKRPAILPTRFANFAQSKKPQFISLLCFQKVHNFIGKNHPVEVSGYIQA